jgi:hemerythrin-like domain-containing protein
MLRDKSLIPLSRQHQHALALCVRIDRASPIEGATADDWQTEISQQFHAEINVHFAAEEQIVFPAASAFPELREVVEHLLADHAWLRQHFARSEAKELTSEEISAFAGRLASHIRKEERQLFERMQVLMSPEDLTRMGQELDRALENAAQICSSHQTPNHRK